MSLKSKFSLVLLLAGATIMAEPVTLPDGLSDLGEIANVTNPQPAWQINSGENAKVETEYGVNGMRILIQSIKSENKKPEANWFTVKTPVISTATTDKANGIALSLAVQTRASWWLSLGLTTDAGTFSQTISPCEYNAGTTVLRLLPFEAFKNQGQAYSGQKITSIILTGSAFNNELAVKRILIYKKVEPQK